MAYKPPGASGARGQITRNIARKEKKRMMAEMQKKVVQPKPESAAATTGLYNTFRLHRDTVDRKNWRRYVKTAPVRKEVQEELLARAEEFFEYNKKHNPKLKRGVMTKENLGELFKKLADNPRDVTTRQHIKTLEKSFGKPTDTEQPGNVVDFQAAKKGLQKPVEAKKPSNIISFSERRAAMDASKQQKKVA